MMNKNKNKDKIGFINVTKEVVDDFWKNSKGMFVPLEICPQQHNGLIKYLVRCSEFSILEECSTIPTYMVEFIPIPGYEGEFNVKVMLL